MLQVAQNFADLLDRSQYEEAASLMSPDCLYTYWEGNYQGPANILNMYKQMEKQAREVFNEYIASSEVEQISEETFVVHASNLLKIQDLEYVSKWDEVLTIEGGKVTAIEYRALPGEVERMREFYVAAGLISNAV